MNKLLCGASSIALLSIANAAHAQGAAPSVSGTAVSEVIVTGTRQTGVKAADSAAPIEVVGSGALTRTGATDLAASLQESVPSLNIDTTGGDIAALTIQAALRGLSPNDTLVLVNGKRRHSTSDLAIDPGSAYTGGATVDLSFIPVDAIDHVEVLTDGAAAQYGTDAVAGVVNIILKNSNHAGVLDGTGGAFFDQQGATGDLQVNKGFNILDKGYFNVTLEHRYHADTVKGNYDARLQNADGSLQSGLTFPNSNVVNAQNYPNENRVNGDPQFDLSNAFWNGGYNITDTVQAYLFGNYSKRIASHFENYRTPSKVFGCTGTPGSPGLVNSDGSYGCQAGTLVTPLANGFDPQEKINESDYSITAGIKGDTSDWHWDLSSTYGEDFNNIYVVHSANAQLFPALQSVSASPLTAQTSFDNGSFKTTELTNSLDISRNFNVGLATPLNVAFGGEQRHDTFSITAGEPNSYYGAGAQSFDGYTPLDQGTHGRTNYAGYIDLAADLITGLHADVAGRYEHYSDFGSTEVGKGTLRYDFNPTIAVRGTFSTGFRAPTLAEEYYSGTNVAPTFADVVLPPNSTAATVAGFGPLKPEKSTNISAGVVLHPLPRLQITADYYNIHLRDRILESGFLYYTNTVGGQIVTVSQGVGNAIKAKGVTLDSGLSYTGISTFANAANTKTQGVEVTANYASDFGDFGHVDWSLGFNYNETSITKLVPLPAVDVNTDPTPGINQTVILNGAALTALTTATPKEKAILQALWTYQKFVVTLRESIYSATSQVSNNGYFEEVGAAGITDLDIGYRFTPSLKVSVGANNLFNKTPPSPGNSGGFPAEGGSVVYNVPYGFSPYGVDGGYYYGRVTYSF